MIYKFSAPLPYNIEDINKLFKINNYIKKSQITSLYFALPENCDYTSGFEQKRNFSLEHKDWEYWKFLISYVIKNGYDFIYLLNSTQPLTIKNKKIEKLDRLLNELNNLGVNKLRVGSLQLASYLSRKYKEFQIFASTALEYKSIAEYQNLLHFHKEIKQIVPSHDTNKNFRLLKNLKKLYPNLEIELMVNEGCMYACPHRMIHEMYASQRIDLQQENIFFSPAMYCSNYCNHFSDKHPFESLALAKNIYPWEIEEYSNIGINNFKLVGRDGSKYSTGPYIKGYELYLRSVDNYKMYINEKITTFIHHLMGVRELDSLKIKEIITVLPKIEHFKKYGHLCASRCGVDCKYCYKCAEKIQKVFDKKQKVLQNGNISVCVINK